MTSLKLQDSYRCNPKATGGNEQFRNKKEIAVMVMSRI